MSEQTSRTYKTPLVVHSHLEPGQAEALVEAAAPILREILMQYRRRIAETGPLPGQAHMVPQNRSAIEQPNKNVADTVSHGIHGAEPT